MAALFAHVDVVAVAVPAGLSVVRDGLDIEIHARMPATLLGLLALRVGELVSGDEIVDVLWADRPPRTCLSLIHGYAAQVRAMFEPDRVGRQASRTLIWARAGYRLVLDRDQVDLTRFADLAQAAGQAQHTEDNELALQGYEQVLACWRGPVLADARARARRRRHGARRRRQRGASRAH